MRLPALALLCALLPAPPAAALTPPHPLQTEAERSGFQRTGRYDEVLRLCADFARLYPDAVRCTSFGASPEGRDMKALVISTRGALTPEAARDAGLPVVLIQGGIHAGEIDGKDAGFLALRQMLENGVAPGALDHVVWVFVPVFNVDGHERFAAWNRPNQRGPEQMGWRTTAQNYNLNRDYAKADAPEMQAMLRLLDAWDPLALVDLHVTDGAQFEHDISITAEPVHAGDARLQAIGRGWRDGVVADLEKTGHLPVAFYPAFVVDDDPSSGFADAVAPPRFSTGYYWLRNRLGMLVETHSWRTYPERVASTRDTIVAVIERIARDGRAWRAEALAADARAAALAGTPVPLAYAPTAQVRTIDFRGYAYTRTPSEISGALMTRYDESTPQVWHVPIRDTFAPTLVIAAPRGGWLVPAAWAPLVEPSLQVHGLRYRRLDAALAAAAVAEFRADTVTPATDTLEGRSPVTVTGAWKPASHDLVAGALFVPAAQPRLRLAMSLLEPTAPDSLLAWGRFNAVFERKEYLEAYVTEAVAREMLAADPALKAEFDAKLAAEPAFAASAAQRLEFFARRHPSWDARWRLYPVLRTDVVPAGG